MGCVWSKQRVDVPSGSPKTRDRPDDCTEILSLTELGKVGAHGLRPRSIKMRDDCPTNTLTTDGPGRHSAGCRAAVQNTRETKPVPPPQRNTQPRSGSLERVMESLFDFDLTYITERIISVVFPPELEEPRYRGNLKEVATMLQSRHQEKYLLLNLSERRYDICQLNPKVEDFGWPDLHAPPLDRICAVCRAVEAWLNFDPQHVVVLHCKGNRGKVGVVVAAYMHYSKISARADQALSTVAMRKFCEDKISPSLHPSQKRYIYYFAGLLSGAVKMKSTSLFLHQVFIPTAANYQPGEGFSPFLKIYQSLQLVYSSGVFDVKGSGSRRLCVSIEPALLLKGDVLVKCYHRSPSVSERVCVFRVQFHTCTVHGTQLWFSKGDLDQACTDDRFPPDGSVEFIFSDRPERVRDGEVQRNGLGVSMDHSPSDPVVRWDSYENFNLHRQDSMEDIRHTRGPLDGSLYAQVRKRRGPGPTVPSLPRPQSPPPPLPRSPDHPSSQSDPTDDPVLPRLSGRAPSEREHRRDGERERASDRETAILDDGELPPPKHDLSYSILVERPCCGRPYSQPCLHCGSEASYLPDGPHWDRCERLVKGAPKHHTLPCASRSPPPAPDVCLSQPDHLWDRGRCLHLPCSQAHLYIHPSRDLAHPYAPHAHALPSPRALTLPAQSRPFSSGEVCPVFCYPGHARSHAHALPPPPHQSLPSGLYREVDFRTPPTASCSCGDCSNLRGDIALREAPALRADPSEVHSRVRELGFGPGPEGRTHWGRERLGESPFDQAQEAECLRRRTALPAIAPSARQCDYHPPTTQAPAHSTAPSPASSRHSSGYHTPRHAPCPCSPAPSPAQSRASHGYASGRQSLNTSPSRACHTPSEAENQLSRHDSATDEDDYKVLEEDFSKEAPGKGAIRTDSPETEDRQWNGDAALDVSAPDDSARNKVVTATTSGDLSSSPKPALLPQVKESPICSSPHSNGHQGPDESEDVSSSPGSTPSLTPELPIGSPEGSSPLGLTPVSDRLVSQEAGSTVDLRGTSPLPDGCATPSFPLASLCYPLLAVPHVPYSGYTAVTIPASMPQPPLPEKRRAPAPLARRSSSSTPASASAPSDSVSMQSDSASTASNSVPTSSESASIDSHFSCLGSDSASSQSDSPLKTDSSISAVSNSTSAPAISNSTPAPAGSNSTSAPAGSNSMSAPAVSNSTPAPGNICRIVSHPGPANSFPSLRETTALLSISSPSSQPHLTLSPKASVLPFSVQSGIASPSVQEENRVSAKFVQDSSKYWYKPGISRDQAIAVLKDKEPGNFLIRDSNSFQGAYGLALKVAKPPPNAATHGNQADPQEQLVRHFLIESGAKGVKIKGCHNESYFGSLTALVHHHSITAVSLPCSLHIPHRDLVGELQEMQSGTNTSTAADLLKQGAACNVLYLNSVETESLTGPQAVSKATRHTLAQEPRPTATVVHFKVSAQGITLTDSQRRLFFRRHYPISSVTFSRVDPQDQRMFGFVAKRAGSASENVCHLFAELDPEQPATAIVNFINKVMLGPHHLRRWTHMAKTLEISK